jgi:hypothetical protein
MNYNKMDFKRIKGSRFEPPLATRQQTIQAYSTTQGKKENTFNLRLQYP